MRILAALVALILVPSAPSSQSVDPFAALPSTTGLVVSANDIASDVGAGVLAKGGNAVDAAVATALALAVTYPSAGNIGGGGFMVVRTPNGQSTTFDYREKAPAKSTDTMFLGHDGSIDQSLTRSGYLAPGVPGTVSGLSLAHKRFGKLPWRDVVMPAADLATYGFPLSASLARSLNNEIGTPDAPGPMARFPASVAAFGKANGAPWIEGDLIFLTDLGKTIRTIATNGPEAFYTGTIADRIAADMAANGGLMTKADLTAYAARERAPIKGTFLGYEILSMPPPSSGGVTLVSMLNQLEELEIQKRARMSAPAVHLVMEAMRRGYLDRARYLGDPDFVRIPMVSLFSKEHARDLVKDVDPREASSSAVLGRDILTQTQAPEPDETTHFSVLDRGGMAVSNTFTLEGGYGSHVVIKGTGILLNNEMGDFNRKPGLTDVNGTIGTPPNVIAPGKRMLSSMTPTIMTKAGRVVLITGSPGSRTIINTVLNIVLNIAAWGMTGPGAVAAARLDHEWMPDRLTIEADGIAPDVVTALRTSGHDVRVQGRQGSAHSIWIDARGQAFGVADKRDPGAKASKPAK